MYKDPGRLVNSYGYRRAYCPHLQSQEVYNPENGGPTLTRNVSYLPAHTVQYLNDSKFYFKKCCANTKSRC